MKMELQTTRCVWTWTQVCGEGMCPVNSPVCGYLACVRSKLSMVYISNQRGIVDACTVRVKPACIQWSKAEAVAGVAHSEFKLLLIV